MSRFFHSDYNDLTPYVPGEQPRDMQYIKLNTNESPFPPAPSVIEAINSEEIEKLRLYPDPELRSLREALAESYRVSFDEVFISNGSDEALYLAFKAFFEDGVSFPDISYGFYPVFALVNNLQAEVRPLREDFRIAPEEYISLGRGVVLANPNAPTGNLLSRDEIEWIVRSNSDNVVVIDEAYMDFSEEDASAIPLIKLYDNLLVVRTFSKSRSLAGARIGYAIGNRELIDDLRTLKFSINPYNVNRLSIIAALASLEDNEYYEEAIRKIQDNRACTGSGLRGRGFRVLDSQANFVFASHPDYDGKELYLELKKRGILVRHFDLPKISEFNRITIGTGEDMDQFFAVLDKILANQPVNQLNPMKSGGSNIGNDGDKAQQTL